MQTILITGGAGFIGSCVTDYLLPLGYKIIVVDNFDSYYDPKLKEQNVLPHKDNPNYVLYRANIEDLPVLKQIFSAHSVDQVVHLAARAGVRPSLENPLAYVQTNINGTMNILECMREYNVKKLVFASSSSVYGNCKAEKFTEDLKVTQPISPYAATKSACEQIIYTYCHLYHITSICLRFFTVFGPRQRPDLAINKFTRLIKNSQPIPLYGDGSSCRDYTYIDDIVSGVCAAINYDKTPYEIINLGGGEPITLKDMIGTIEKVLGKKAKISYLPMQPGDVDRTVCDYSKANRLLNYYPKTSFEEGVRKFIEWASW